MAYSPFVHVSGPTHALKRMTPKEIETYGRRLYGSRSWRNRLAANIGVTRQAVGAWMRGEAKISEPTAQLIKTRYAELKAQRAREQALK